ncbi:MAG: hypothetical protein ACRDIA_01345 [Actinomycetota bacterium]
MSFSGLVEAFLGGGRTGFSAELHIESDTLLAQRSFVIGARLGPDAFLVRSDVPQDILELKDRFEQQLRSTGFADVEPEARLGDIAAIQVTGIRGAFWDLWGKDASKAHRALERAVLGDDGGSLEMVHGPVEDTGVGMTLEDLLGEIGDERGDKE